MESPDRFEQIVLPHLDSLYRAAVALCGRTDEAEDLVQTTVLKAFERAEMFERGTNGKAWLFQIMRHTRIDQLRHRRVVGNGVAIDEALVLTEPETEATTWSDARDLLENFSDEQVIRALKRLPEDQRLTLFLTDVEQLSQQEVAEITGAAIGTVKSRASRARNELKKHLLAYAKEMGFAGRDR